MADNITIKLRELIGSLTPMEKRVAEYVSQNLTEIPKMSVKMLARNSETSEASVMRFCKSFGYTGYRDFIVDISSSLGAMEDETNQYTDIQPGDDLETIISNISLNNCRSIEDTIHILDKDAVRQAVALLRSTRKVDFFGMGASGLVCQDAQQKFTRIHMNCHAYIDGHSQLTAASLMEKGDAAVLVSNSGNTKEIIETLRLARENGASLIAITRYAKSILALESDIVLHISTPEITIRSGAMGSRIAMLNIIDILFAGVASADYELVKPYLSKTHDALKGFHIT